MKGDFVHDVNSPSIDLTGYQVRLDSMQISLVKSAKTTLWSTSTLLYSSKLCRHTNLVIIIYNIFILNVLPHGMESKIWLIIPVYYLGNTAQ